MMEPLLKLDENWSNFHKEMGEIKKWMNWKKSFQYPKGDGLVVQPLFGATKVPGSNLLQNKWKPHSVLYPILLCSPKKKEKVGPPKRKVGPTPCKCLNKGWAQRTWPWKWKDKQAWRSWTMGKLFLELKIRRLNKLEQWNWQRCELVLGGSLVLEVAPNS